MRFWGIQGGESDQGGQAAGGGGVASDLVCRALLLGCLQMIWPDSDFILWFDATMTCSVRWLLPVQPFPVEYVVPRGLVRDRRGGWMSLQPQHHRSTAVPSCAKHMVRVMKMIDLRAAGPCLQRCCLTSNHLVTTAHPSSISSAHTPTAGIRRGLG